jgi:hypothetical protein
VIKPDILLSEEVGLLRTELLALPDKRFCDADTEEKLAMIEYVKGLRLVVWLLRAQNYLSFTDTHLQRVVQSNLGYQASLTSTWIFASPISHLVGTVGFATITKVFIRKIRRMSHIVRKNMPWSRRIHWLQCVKYTLEKRRASRADFTNFGESILNRELTLA